LQQLAWLTAGTPVAWRVYAVDDGDPHGSGELAANIAAGEVHATRVRVLSLADAQAAFELYEADLLREIISTPTVFDFSFDSDWILAAIARGETIETVPFAFIDSAAESASIAQGPMTTWETLLLGLVKAVRRHAIPHDEAMARVIDEEIHSARDPEPLTDHLPPELEGASDAELGEPDLMTPEALQPWIRERKRNATPS
jgi:hypothetical protein